MKNTNLPDFNEMARMAKEEPEKLEKIRKNLVDQVIKSAPEENRLKLRGLQNRIDLIKQGSNNNLDSANKLFKEMMSSFDKLNEELNNFSNTQSKPQKNVKPKFIIEKDNKD